MKAIAANKQRKLGIVLQYMQMGISILVSLLYTPVMLRMLGQNEYGIYSVSSSIISYLSLLSLGLGSSYIRFYSMYKNQDNGEKVKSLNGMYFSVFVVIGLIALGAGLAMSFNAGAFYNDSYTVDEIGIAKVLMIFLSINLAISFPSSVFVSYISSQERFIWQKIVNMASTVVSPCANIILLYCGFGSIGMVVTSTCVSILVSVANVWFCFRKLNMKMSFRSFDWRLFKNIFVFSFFIALHQVIDQVNWQTDKIILGKLATGSAVAVYSVAASINNMYLQFSIAISSVYAPKVNAVVAENGPNCNDELVDLMIKVGRLQFFVINLILTGFIFFGQYFISRWAGEGYENSYIIALLLIVPATLTLTENLALEIRRAKNMHKVPTFVMLGASVLNVAISIWFAYLWGEVGVAIGTTISLVLNFFFVNIYYALRIKLNMVRFFKKVYIALPSLAVPCVCGALMMVFWKPTSLTIFAVQIVIYTLIYGASVALIGLNKNEKKVVFAFLMKRGKKKEEGQASEGAFEQGQPASNQTPEAECSEQKLSDDRASDNHISENE